jgi:tetratricopeptide (TPR) repeat protein
MPMTPGHVWLVGDRAADRTAALELLGKPEISTNCHRRLRGPYTGISAVLDELLPTIMTAYPDLVERHRVALTTAVPWLTTLVGAPQPTLTTLAEGEERTRYYSPVRAWRVSHGLIELIEEYTKRRGRPLVIGFENVQDADDTDQWFLSLALRRWHPDVVRVVLAGSSEPPLAQLCEAIAAHSTRLDAAASTTPANSVDPVFAFVASDGTSDDPIAVTAWRAAEPDRRGALHDARAAELATAPEHGQQYGALPWHLEHGSRAATEGAEALETLLRQELGLGLYAAAVDAGDRALSLIDVANEEQRYCQIALQTCLALMQTGRVHEARERYISLRGRFRRPLLHMSSSYALAMLYTRLLPPGERDHELARSYAVNAVLLARSADDPEERAFYTVFQQNGLALVELHRGDFDAARTLVTDGLDRLERETRRTRFRLHKSVLLHNRATVYVGLQRLRDALADFDQVIALDPYHPDYYLDRGNLHRKLGDDVRAIADYETAIRVGPPFPEAHYNRADVRAANNDIEGAVADFGYALELEPDNIDARVNLVGLLTESGAIDEARHHIEEGLRINRDEPRLLCALGVLMMEDDPAESLTYFDRSLNIDPALRPALVNKAIIVFDAGDHRTAVSLLTSVIERGGGNATVLYNRGFALQAMGLYAEAISDYDTALQCQDPDAEDVLEQRSTCLRELGRVEGAEADPLRRLGTSS